MTATFSLTYDYLCPFARIANEAVIESVASGADWSVRFHPFSLSQTKVGEGEPAAWEPGAAVTRGVVAHQWGIAVRDRFADRFGGFHLALFAARFDRGADVDDAAVLRGVAADVGLPVADVADVVAGGEPLSTLAAEHTEAVQRWGVFGVPTFIAGEHAVFVRLMERHCSADVARVVDMLTWDRLNEFKRTRIPR